MASADPQRGDLTGGYERFCARWAHLELPDYVHAAVRVDDHLRADVVDVALQELARSPRLRRRFLGALDRELAAGEAALRAAHRALLAVERAAIARGARWELGKVCP